jgi:hypothetical protein
MRMEVVMPTPISVPFATSLALAMLFTLVA